MGLKTKSFWDWFAPEVEVEVLRPEPKIRKPRVKKEKVVVTNDKAKVELETGGNISISFDNDLKATVSTSFSKSFLASLIKANIINRGEETDDLLVGYAMVLLAYEVTDQILSGGAESTKEGVKIVDGRNPPKKEK